MTEQYENAVFKYYSKLKIVPLPLTSWGLFLSRDIETNQFNLIQNDWTVQEKFWEIVHQTKQEIIITNVKQEIVFATQGIYSMNGYHPYEIIGKSPKIFQGKLTSEENKNTIRVAIQNRQPFKEILINYRKDGSTYLCEINAFPKFNKKGELINYIAFEKIAS